MDRQVSLISSILAEVRNLGLPEEYTPILDNIVDDLEVIRDRMAGDYDLR